MGAVGGAPFGRYAAVMLLLILVVVVSFVWSCFIHGKSRSKSTLMLMLGLAAMLAGIVIYFTATIVIYNTHGLVTLATGSLVAVGVLAFAMGTLLAARGFVVYTRAPGKSIYRWLFALGLSCLVGAFWVAAGGLRPAHPEPPPPVELTSLEKQAAAEIKRTLGGVWCGVRANELGYERAYRYAVKGGAMKMSEMRVGPAWASTRCDDSGACTDLRDTTWGEPRTCTLRWINGRQHVAGVTYMHSNCEGGPHSYSLIVELPSGEVGMSVGRDRLSLKSCSAFDDLHR